MNTSKRTIDLQLPKMILSPKSTLLFLIGITLICIHSTIAISGSDSDIDQIAELLDLQSRSKSGIIHLDDHTVNRFITSLKTPRPYSLLIFFDAVQLHDKSELRLKELRNEFSLLASSFITNNNEKDSRTKLFFCDIEFKESQSSFAQFGVNSLPKVILVAPHVKTLKDSDQMDPGDFSRLADSMSDFVQLKTKLEVGPIHRPPVISRNQLILVLLLALIGAPFLAKKVLAGETLINEPRVWLSGAVFVYFFSVSGAMHNIIRKMPMFIPDRNDPMKMVFFHQGSGMQLGAEGFTVGFLYTIVGLLLAFTTHVLVRVRNLTAQRLVMFVALAISFWAVKQVIYLDNWKTGYGVHAFWPTSWN